jgi:predicted secreted protein
VHITFDFDTVVWTVVGILTGFGVYQWSEPTAPTTPTAPAVGMTNGERLVLALTAAVAVITIGNYLSSGVEKVEIDKPTPSATMTVSK